MTDPFTPDPFTPGRGPGRGSGSGSRPRLDVVVGDAELTPGHPATVMVLLRNLEAAPRTYTLSLVGIDREWVAGPGRVGPVAPGEAATVALTVTLPSGFPASDLAASLGIQPRDPETGTSVGPLHAVDLVLAIGDGTSISATLEPPDVRGGERGRFLIVLHNRGRLPSRVELSAASVGDEVKFRFGEPTVAILPGEEVQVKAQLRADRPWFGSPRRRPFVVRVQGRSTPVLLDGAFTQRAVISKSAFRILAVVILLGIWVTLALVVLSRVSGVMKNHAAKASTSGPATGTPIAGGVTGGNGSAGGGAGGTGGGAGGGSGGGGGGAGAGNGGASGGAGAGTTGTGSGATGASAGTRISGKVSAPTPGGIMVSIAPKTLVDETAQQGGTKPQLASASASASAGAGPPGKVLAQLSAPLAGQAVGTTDQTTTNADGSWAFVGVHAPGYYLVTFTKPGYQTQSFVVTTTADNAPVQLGTTLKPGTGAIGGSVVSATTGPLGGVDLTITNGTLTLVTRTPTTGAVGTWGVSGLATPGTYLVTAARSGFATQTSLVTLTAGQTVAGVVLNMPSGAGSITGTVSSNVPVPALGIGIGDGVGGLTVTATTGSTTLMATTSTVDPIGSYTLPNLAVPATYSLTISGTGWLTQTKQVVLNGNMTVDAMVTPTTGSVTGNVTTPFGGSGACGDNPPIANPPGVTTDPGLGNAGLVLSNDQFTFKALSQSDTANPGLFNLDGIPPGHYTLSASAFEYASLVTQVDVTPGATVMFTKESSLSLKCSGPVDQDTSQITGHVADLFDPSHLLPHDGAGMFVAVDGTDFTVSQCSAMPNVRSVCYAPNTGDYTISGLSAGIHQIKASAPMYESVTVQASAGLGTFGFAPTANLPRLDTLTGVITSNAGGFVGGATVTLCHADGITVATGTSTPDGAYTIIGLTHGTYRYAVTAPGFVSSAADCEHGPTLTLALDTDLVQNVALDRLAILQVNALKASDAGMLVADPSVTVTVTDITTNVVIAPDGGTGTTYSGLANSHKFSVSFDPSAAVCSVVPGPTQRSPCQFTARLNQTFVVNAFAPSPQVNGSLQWMDGTVATPVPAAGAQVAMTTVVSYTSTGSGSVGVPVTKTYLAPGSDGGGTITQGTTLPTTFQFTDAVNLASTASFKVTAPGFQEFDTTVSTLNGSVGTFTMTPLPVPVSGTVELVGGAGDDFSGITVAVGYNDPNHTPKVSVGSSGAITWVDTRTTGNQAVPGTYTLTFSKAGYDDAIVTAAIPLCTTTGCSFVVHTDGSNPARIQLNKKASIIATASDATTHARIPGATFTLLNNADSTVQQVLTDTSGNGTVTFQGLSNSIATYRVTATAPGYPATASGNASKTVSVTPGGSPTVDLTLTALGSISGTLNLNPSGDGTTFVFQSGITVTATRNDGTKAGCFHATTAANGTFKIVGDTTPSCEGLTDGDYTVSATVAGYPNLSLSPVTISGGAQVVLTAAQTTLKANKIAISGVVNDFTVDAGGHHPPLQGVTVSAQNPVTLEVFTADLTDANGNYSLSLQPVSYQISFSLTGYTTFTEALALFPGEAPQTLATVSLHRNLSKVIGATFQQLATGAPTNLPGVTVTVDNNPALSAVSATDATSGKATYTIPNVPDGNHVVTFSLTGYDSPPGQNVTVMGNPSGNTTFTVNGTLTPTAHAVDVTVISPVPMVTIGMNDATVTLDGIAPGTLTSSSGVVTFPSVSVGVAHTVVATRNQGGPAITGSTTFTVHVGDASPTNVTIHLNEGEITGTITAHGGTGPPPSAAVAIKLVSPATSLPAPTVNGDGTYHAFVNLGTYSLTFTAPGYTNLTPPNTMPSSATPLATVDADMMPAPRDVTVTVASAVGPDTISGAKVTLTGATVPTMTTGTDGKATFHGVPTGDHSPGIDATGATVSSGQVTPHLGQPSGTTATFNVPVATVTSPAAVQATVQLVEGEITGTASAGNATVTVTVADSAGTTGLPAPFSYATSNGTYAIFVPPGKYDVSFQAPGYTGDTAHQNITVENSQMVSGVNANMVPLPRTVDITVTSQIGGTVINNASVSLDSLPAMHTGTNGVATFTSVAPGSHTATVDTSGATDASGAAHLGHPPTSPVPVNVDVDVPQAGNPNPRVPVTIQLAEGKLTGAASPSSGSGAVTVDVAGTTTALPSKTFTTTSGSYSIFLPGGQYNVTFSDAGDSADPHLGVLVTNGGMTTLDASLMPPPPPPHAAPIAPGSKSDAAAEAPAPATHTVIVSVRSTVGNAAAQGATVTLGSSTQVTGKDGTTTFNSVSPGSYTVTAARSSTAPAATASAPLAVPSGATTKDPISATLTLAEAALSGTVTPHGSPDLVTVQLTNPAGGTVASPSVRADGTYQAFVPPDTYRVTMTSPGYQPSPPVTVALGTPGQQATGVDATLAVLSHTVTVQVLSAVPVPSRTPLDGAAVTLKSIAGGAAPSFGPAVSSLVAQSHGIVTFADVPPGQYTISVDPGQVKPAHQSLTVNGFTVPVFVNDPSTVPVTIHEVEIRGAVSVSSGSGSVAVTITGTPAGALAPVSLSPPIAGGSYDVFLAPGTYTVSLSANGYATPAPVTVTLTSGQRSVQAPVALAPMGHNVAVNVVSAVGSAPLDGARVTLTPSGASGTSGTSGTSGGGPPAQTVTAGPLGGNHGVADFAGVGPGAYVISVDATGLNPAHGRGSAAVTVPASPTDPPPVTVTIAEGEITGSPSVTEGPGSVAVKVSGPTAVTPPVAAGSFDAFVPPGNYTLAFSAAGYQTQTVTNQAVTNGNTLTLSPTLAPLSHAVKVTVKSDAGPVAAGAVVTLSGIGGTRFGPATTGADGSVTFSSIPPGSYTVSVNGTGATAGGQPAPHLGPPSGATTTISVPFAPTAGDPVAAAVALVEGQLSGSVSVSPASGSACPAGGAVSVSITGPASTTQSAAPGGSYRAFLPPGHYTVVFSAAGCQSQTSPATIGDGQSTTVNGSVS